MFLSWSNRVGKKGSDSATTGKKGSWKEGSPEKNLSSCHNTEVPNGVNEGGRTLRRHVLRKKRGGSRPVG